MATPDFETSFQCRDGRPVVISIDDGNYTVTVRDSDGGPIGSTEFNELDGCLKLVWAFLDKQEGRYLHQGIGEECVRLMRERYGMPIVAEDNDGISKDDGSHLTGDAPAFIAKMRRKGLIEPSPHEDHDG